MRYKQRFFPPVGYVPQVYGYGRVSHKNQLDKGQSIPDQEARIKAYLELRKLDASSPFNGAEWAGMQAEPKAQSAFKRRFSARPAGKELSRILKPSDHVIVDKLDRIVRSQEDWAEIDRYFAERGITLHIVNHRGCSIDGNTAAGRFMLSAQVLFSEYESDVKAERVRDARARLRAQKRDAGVPAPQYMEVVGCAPGRVSGSGGRRQFRDWFQPVIERVLYMHDQEKMTWRQICMRLWSDRKGLPFGTPRFNPQQIERMYWFWRAWQAAGTPDVNEIKVGEFVETYKRENKNGQADV